MATERNGNDMWKKITVGIIVGLVVAGISGLVGYVAAGNTSVAILEKKHDRDVAQLSITITEIQTTNKYTKEKLDEISRAVNDLQKMMRDERP